MAGTNYINGEWVTGSGLELIAINPSTGDTSWTGATSTPADVDSAVTSAQAAAYSWRNISIVGRIAIIERFGELVTAAAEELGAIITAETGKPLWESKTEARAMAAKIAISVTAHMERGGTTVQQLAGAASITRHRPIGVLAVFGPYNFPGHLPNGHIVPALIAGNTIIFKPSELAPRTAQRTVELWQEAGLPAGVINLVQGAADTGRALSAHPNIDGLLFTGSVETGRILHKQFAGHPEKMLALELGGNNPLVVRQVADMDAALLATIESGYISAGQRCTCARRLFVPNGPWGDEFVDRLTAAVSAIKVGDPAADEQPYIGPVVSKRAAQAMVDAQKHLVDLGAAPLVELRHLNPDTGFVSPGLIDVTGIDDVPDEEYFGPLVQLYRYDLFDEAIAGANDTEFGLAASLLSDDHLEYELFLREVEAGIINWNRSTTGASSSAPFGGIGASGNHRPAAYYATDYVTHPVASIESAELTAPEVLPPGITLP
jgi:succinylglutamic semialdehyde dehydrogenase